MIYNPLEYLETTLHIVPTIINQMEKLIDHNEQITELSIFN